MFVGVNMPTLRRRLVALASTALTGFSLVLIPSIFSSRDSVAAQEVSAGAAQVQAAKKASIYNMPSGDHTAGLARTGPGVVIPRRSPTPGAELQRLKRLPGEPSSASVVDGSPTIEPKALYKECVTNIATGFAPSDIHGAAGSTNLVVVTNVDIGIYNKSNCGIVSRVPLRSFFGGFGIPSTQTLFDPRVLYDRPSGRCLVVVESRDSTNTDQFLYIAGSTSSSCTSWNLRRFTLSSGASVFCKAAASDFYDYPNAGYNVRRLVVTSNNFGASVYGTLLSIDKPALYSNGGVSGACFRPLTFNLAPAVVGDSNASMFVLSPGSGSGSSLSRLRLTTSASGVGSDTLASTSSISIAAWTAPPAASQPNGELIDTLDGRFQSASKQLGSLLWNVKAVNIGGFARHRLYKLSTTGTTALFTRTPTTSTCANADHLFNPSIDTNSTSTSALAFVTSSRTCPSQATAGNVAHVIFRGPNSSTANWVFTTIQTSASQYTGCGGGCRWGDYSSTQIDPSSTGRAWGFNQLVTGSSQFSWNTRAGLVGP